LFNAAVAGIRIIDIFRDEDFKCFARGQPITGNGLDFILGNLGPMSIIRLKILSSLRRSWTTSRFPLNLKAKSITVQIV
jgi:hypothetical protein